MTHQMKMMTESAVMMKSNTKNEDNRTLDEWFEIWCRKEEHLLDWLNSDEEDDDIPDYDYPDDDL